MSATSPLSADRVVHLVQLLLPLNDNTGKPVPKAQFDEVRKTLLDRFGGLTAHTQTPATGLWTDDDQGSDTAVRDVIVTYEVMVEQLDTDWWADYRQKLETAFGQKELVIRAQRIQRL